MSQWPSAAMIASMHDEPEFSELFMAYLLTRNSRIAEDLIDQLFNSSETRLARLLLILAKFRQERQAGADRWKVQSGNARGDDRHDPIARGLLHGQIPQLGYIDYNRKLEIHNSLLNVVLYDKVEINTKNTRGGAR
jgi:CRP/FNR family transcriptional regulator, cyclic AMP receptor protein